MGFKDLVRRLCEIEKKTGTGTPPTFIIVHFGEADEVNFYSREVNGPGVTRDPGESENDFLKRAEAALFGEEAKKGVHLMFADTEACGQETPEEPAPVAARTKIEGEN